MCGIAGGTRFHSKESINRDILIDMLKSIRHRGPDESGIYLSDEIGMGNVRLSIIDLSTGQQPLSNFSGDIWIVYNGEVFNYPELREELLKKGYKFKTHSDTEVIVLLYQEYGIDFISKLNGQFAISIWDKRKHELILIRDRVGIRPLFYTRKNNEVYYASEIKALLQHPAIEAKFSPKSLSQIFTFWTCISPDTPFENIYELPPGHYMTCSKEKITIKSYWDLNFPEKDGFNKIKLDDALGKFKEILSDATKIRLRADVPVAAYLSGGIDSTVTTSLIREVVPDMLETFSVGFTDKDFDESEYQELASEYYHTRHTGFKIKSSEIAEIFPEVVWHCETPILRTSPAPMFALSKKVRENNIKVVITGEGADEILAGYNIFKESKIRQFWAKEPNSKFRPLLLKKLYPYIPQISSANTNALKFFFGYRLSETDNPAYSHLLRWNNGNHIKKYFSNEILQQIQDYHPVNELISQISGKLNNYDSLAKAQWLELKIFMSGYLLSSQGDRMAMANSVEGRYPFLDYRLIEFCASLNPDFKLNGLNEKYLLKKMASDRIPEKILHRPKQAYRAPIQSSFIGKSAPGYVANYLNIDKIKEQQIFDPLKTSEFIKKINSGKITSEVDNMALTAIITSGIVYDQFVNRKFLCKTEDFSNCKIIIE
jgi:asparagine synthase (glutamine-hydrolysing)